MSCHLSFYYGKMHLFSFLNIKQAFACLGFRLMRKDLFLYLIDCVCVCVCNHYPTSFYYSTDELSGHKTLLGPNSFIVELLIDSF